mgnify:CR=1 FL=1
MTATIGLLPSITGTAAVPQQCNKGPAATTLETPEYQAQETAMNTSMNRHPFALAAFVLSVLITSTMTLIPALAGAGTNHSARDAQTIQTAAVQTQQVRNAG